MLQTVLSALAVISLVLAAPLPGRTVTPVSTGRHNAVVSLQLAEQMAGIGTGPFAPQRRYAPIGVVVKSTRDVSRDIRALGGTVESDLGTLTAASLPPRQISALARRPGVITLYPSQRLQPQLDISVPEIRANLAWSLTDTHGLPVTGHHVLVGIVGSGIDYSNPDFQNPDGSTRIRFIWDQSRTGTPPAGFTFGNECGAAAIDAGTCSERDTEGHDTHTAGIAAGNGRSSDPSREIGVSPDADIIAVKTADLTSDSVIAAWQYLVKKAADLGEPIVINNSFGGMLSPHDGSAPNSQALDRLSGPGRIFVAAAGNTGHRQVHTDGDVPAGGTLSVPLSVGSSGTSLHISFFYPAAADLSVGLSDLTTGDTYGPVLQGGDNDGQTSKDGSTTVYIESGSWDNTRHEADISIKSTSGLRMAGQDVITLTNSGSTPVHVDGWIAETNVARFDNADDADTVADPADAHSVISVGNYATRVTWTGEDGRTHNVCNYIACPGGTLSVGDIVPSSALGPTADGREKPDIAAPGTMIISSRSKDFPVCATPTTATDTCVPLSALTPDGKNLIAGGTSMAAPHVAGTIALMLQVDPTLDPSTVDGILRATARHDAFTATAAWSPAFGAGKLDAYAAVSAVLNMVRARPTATATPTVMPAPRPTATATSKARRSARPHKHAARHGCRAICPQAIGKRARR